MTIRVGDTVTWTNSSTLIHSVTADPSAAENPDNVELPEGASPFDSGILSPGETFTKTFDVAGTYRYVCLPHEADGMLGTVIVTP